MLSPTPRSSQITRSSAVTASEHRPHQAGNTGPRQNQISATTGSWRTRAASLPARSPLTSPRSSSAQAQLLPATADDAVQQGVPRQGAKGPGRIQGSSSASNVQDALADTRSAHRQGSLRRPSAAVTGQDVASRHSPASQDRGAANLPGQLQRPPAIAGSQQSASARASFSAPQEVPTPSRRPSGLTAAHPLAQPEAGAHPQEGSRQAAAPSRPSAVRLGPPGPRPSIAVQPAVSGGPPEGPPVASSQQAALSAVGLAAASSDVASERRRSVPGTNFPGQHGVQSAGGTSAEDAPWRTTPALPPVHQEVANVRRPAAVAASQAGPEEEPAEAAAQTASPWTGPLQRPPQHSASATGILATAANGGAGSTAEDVHAKQPAQQRAPDHRTRLRSASVMHTPHGSISMGADHQNLQQQTARLARIASLLEASTASVPALASSVKVSMPLKPCSSISQLLSEPEDCWSKNTMNACLLVLCRISWCMCRRS